MESLRQGNAKECVKIVATLYERNINKQSKLSSNSLLLTSIISTLYRFADECPAQTSETYSTIEKSIETLKSTLPSATTSEFLCEIISDICASRHGSQLQATLIDNAIDLITLHYTDSRLSLTFISEKLGITEIYLSHVFKETTGINYTEYVENLRMKKAQGLLFNTKKSISEIAEAVGYNSPQSFRRVYKKHYNKTPRQ